MKAALLLLLCTLCITSSFAAVISVTTVPLACNLLNICDLTAAGVLSANIGVGDTLQISTTTATKFSLSKALNFTSLVINGAAGNTLMISSGAVVVLSGTLQASAATVVSVSDASSSLIVSGLATFDNATMSVTGSATFNGGITVTSNSNGQNQGLVVQSSATVIIAADSTINGAISLAVSSILIIRSGTTTLGASVTASGNVTVQSTLSLASTATTYTQSQGALILGLAGSTAAQVSGSVALSSSAYLQGQGTITGSLQMSSNAVLQIGNSPGTVFINGNFQMDSTSTFDWEAASDSNFDKLIVKGTATVNGILACHLLNGYAPNNGQSYTFITAAGGTSGSFNIVRGDNVATALKWKANVGSNQIASVYGSAATATASILILSIALIYSLLM